jgi:hypothetical protein
MRNALLLLLCAVTSITTNAQVPVNRSMAMVEKSTYSECGPCGTWGWTMQDELIADNMVGSTPKAIVLETHGYYSAYHTETAMFLIQSWIDSAFPRWAVNNRSDPSNGTYTNTRTTVKKTVDSIAALSPIASTGFYYTLTGNTIKFYTKTQFWKAASGIYSIAAYIVEDCAYGEQFGQPNDKGYHRYVLRDRISKYTFGDTLAKGSIAANEIYSKNYTYTITRTDWNKSHLSFMTVIFKKNAADSTLSEVININSLKSAPNGVGNVSEAVDQLIVYPNPVTDRVNISGALTVAADTRISVINAIGQTVYEKVLSYQNNQLAEDIDLRGLSNGIYTLLIRTEGAQTMHKLIVAH